MEGPPLRGAAPFHFMGALVASWRIAQVALAMELTQAEWTAVGLSLKVATVAALAGLPFGVAVAWLLARRDFPGKGILNALVHMPLVLPPVVTGWLLLIGFGREGIFGRALEACCGLVFSFRWTGAALAAATMGFPLVVRAIRLSLEAVDPRLEQAAATLGAPGWRVFLTVTLPLAAPGVIAGLVLGFAKSIGEFGATITFVANIPGETQTIATAIYTTTQDPNGTPATIRLTLIALSIAFAAIVASEGLAARAKRRGQAA